MPLSGWITMIVIMSFVWGGTVLIVMTALRKEAGKREESGRRGEA